MSTATPGNLVAAVEAGFPPDLLIPILPSHAKPGANVDLQTEKTTANVLGKAPFCFNPSTGWWRGLRSWQTGATAEQRRVSDEAGANVGLLLGVPRGASTYLALDVDTKWAENDPASQERANEICRIVVKTVCQHLGVASVWCRMARRRRIAILIRVADGHAGKKTILGLHDRDIDRGKIEVLAQGQQVVIGGTHASNGGTPIVWFRGLQDGRTADTQRFPIAAELPTLPTESHVTELVDMIVRALETSSITVSRSKPAPRPESRPAEITPADQAPPSADRLVELLDAMPNPERFDDRGNYVNVMRAVSGCIRALSQLSRLEPDDQERIRDAAVGWAVRWQGAAVDEAIELEKWESDFARNPADTLGWPYLAGVAVSLGSTDRHLLKVVAQDRQAHTLRCAQEEFKATDEPSELPRQIFDPANPALADQLPELIIRRDNVPATARALGALIAQVSDLFERPASGRPVRVALDADGLPRIEEASVEEIVYVAHQHCRPMAHDRKGELRQVALPENVAKMVLAVSACRDLRPLRGVAASPLIDEAGGIRSANGYDNASALWCCKQPKLSIPAAPMRQEAEHAFLTLREVFSGFPTGGERVLDVHGVARTNLKSMPNYDEAALLYGLLTAVARPSLDIAPGFLITAPALNGAGTGKGLASRVICSIAFGSAPWCISPGRDDKETDARITGELLLERPVLMLDNFNSRNWSSDILASALTEGRISQRPLGGSRMIALTSRTFVILNGNALGISEDLVSRFVTCRFDSGMESPETRRFDPNFLEDVHNRRPELLSAALTIIRWGLMEEKLPRGASCRFPQWMRFVRDPLMALGCPDPIVRAESDKQLDPEREHLRDVLRTWFEAHGNAPTGVKDLADSVRALLSPSGNRQAIAPAVQRLAGTRVAGFSCTLQPKGVYYEAARYVVEYDGPALEPPVPPAPVASLGLEFFGAGEARVH